MESYALRSVLYEGATFKTHEAWSERDQKDVIVKVYKRSDMLAAECLLKEAMRQAREKPQESAALIDVVLCPAGRRGTGKELFVNFVLEKRESIVKRDIIERDDDRGQFQHEMDGYDNLQRLYAQGHKEIYSANSMYLKRDVIIKRQLCQVVSETNDLVKEAFMLAYVEHPYNCQLFDIGVLMNPGESCFKFCIVMEKFESDVSKDLTARVMRGQPYTEVELLQCLRDVAEGFAHAKNLVTFYTEHRAQRHQAG